METKEPTFRRIPPGDRWKIVDGSTEQVFTPLTAALEYYFQKTGLKQYYIDAEEGVISVIKTEPDPPPPVQKFSIYGDY